MTKRIILFFVMIFAVNGFSGGYIGGKWYPWWDGALETREICVDPIQWECIESFKRLEVSVIGIRDIDERSIELEYSDFKIFTYSTGEIYTKENWPLLEGRPMIRVPRTTLITWLKNNNKELKFTNNYWEDNVGNIIDGVEPIDIQFNLGKSKVVMIETTWEADEIYISDQLVD